MKARARKTLRRKSETTADGPLDNTPSRFRAPTESEWQNMPCGKMFIIADTRFRKGDE
jgi:hypothetical protein